MAMNRSRSDDIKRNAQLVREEAERLERDGVPLGQALIYLDKLLDNVFRSGTVNAVKFPPHRTAAAHKALKDFLKRKGALPADEGQQG
jgi:hypothetical protein